jgi:antitoxin (DNA-binding transcriptional repressor) of toxin-antitoxin stability system
MKTYSIRSAREHFAELADLAEKGEPVRIERKGRAPLVLVAERDFRAPSDRFLTQLDALRRETGGVDFTRPAGRPTSRRMP